MTWWGASALPAMVPVARSLSLGGAVRGGDGAIVRKHVHHPWTALYIMAVLDNNKNILRVFESRNEVHQGDALTCDR
jgi:hypothetical protein